MRKSKKSRKVPIVLIILIAVAVISVYCFILVNYQIPIPSIELSAVEETTCPAMKIEGTCTDAQDCLDLLPEEFPGDITEIGTLECIDSNCIFIENDCIDGFYEV
jgi:hypothetical protein